MTTLWLDLETYSETPIRNGTYRYAENSEILLVAWAVDDGPVRVDEGVTDDFKAAFAAADEIVAHNAQFDRVVLAAHGVEREITAWRCTMVQALTLSLPGSLDFLCALFRVPQDKAKLKDGKYLVRLFCSPRPKNMKLRRAIKETHPAEWARFCEYAAHDIEAMRVIRRKMPSWNYRGEHLALWHLDQVINDRGVYVDQDLSRAAVDAMGRLQRDLAKETDELTGGAVTSATQRDKLLQHILSEYGVELPDMRGSTLERRLNDESLPDPVRQLIAIRLESGLIGGKKHTALLHAVSRDGRLRGLLQFCGASRTGRWAGRVFQPQNLTRPPKYLEGRAYDDAVDAITAGVVDLIYDVPMEVISATVRGALIAAPGHKFVIADLNAIEARVLAWLARDTWVLDDFAAGKDPYKAAYSAAFGAAYDEVTDQQRQVGKVMILALGYQGAVGAVRSMAGPAGEAWTDEFIVDAVVKPWRASRPGTVSLWYDVERAAKRAVAHPGQPVTLAGGLLKVQRDSAWLRIRLPSGRCLSYPFPECDDNVLSYMGTNQYTRQWTRIPTYGGKLVENVVQATARDILAHGLALAEAAGLRPVLTVHDEIICEPAADNAGALDRLVACMATTPAWAPGLLLEAKGFETNRYRK